LHTDWRAVLRVADLFHPFDPLAIKLFRDRDVRHRTVRRGPVPVFLAGRSPDDVSLPDLLDGVAPSLHPPRARRHNQDLSERVGVPSRPRAWLERDASASRTGRGVRLEQRLNARRTGEVFGLHHQFKSVTAMSPLQFQKQIRLQEARRLMLGEDLDAASAGIRVGYEDPSYFSREYKKLFGAPPLRDITKLRSNLEL
jgi:hypothetical protein